MMMNEKWIDDISKMMDGYEIAAPDVSLSEIEARVAAKKKAKIIPLWRSRIAIAASVLAIAGIVATMMLQEDGSVSQQDGGQLAQGRLESTTARAIDSSSNRQLDPSKSRNLEISKSRNNVITLSRNNDKTTTLPPKNNIALASATPSQQAAPQKKEQNNQQENPTKQKKYPQKNRTSLPTTGDYGIKKQKTHSRLTAAVYMGNGLGNSRLTPMPMMAYAATTYGSSLADMVYDEVYLMTSAGVDERNRNVDHSQPIRFGVSLKYGLTERWSVATGLTYTYLRSDITEESSAYTMQAKQKIGYVGVPLTVGYTFFTIPSVDVYASAGATVEMPIAAKSEETTISNGIVTSEQSRSLPKSALQLSANIALGAEYRFADNLGIYVEPGLGYYFDNGSRLETIYQDKPLNVNLNLGLRYTIK